MRKTLLAVALACLSTSALADTVTIGLSENGGPLSVFTNVPTTGLFNLPFGDWTIFTREAGGPGTFGYEIDNFANVASSLHVIITSQNNTVPTGINDWFAEYRVNALTAGWTINESVLFDSTNGLFGGTQMDSQTFTVPTVLFVSTPLDYGSGPYSMTATFDVTAVGAGQAWSDINVGSQVAVPGPVAGEGTVGIAACLLMLFLAGRRKHDKFSRAYST